MRPLALAALTLLIASCSAQPIPRVVVAGTTFTFLAGSGSALFGYQSLATRMELRYDDQRGEVIFYLYPTSGLGSPTDPNHPNNVRLTTRFITRFTPDPASQAGIQNEVGGDDLPGYQTTLEIEQVLAFLDVPLTRNSPSLPIAGTYNVAYRLVRGHDPLAANVEVLYSNGYNPEIVLEVVAGTTEQYTLTPTWTGHRDASFSGSMQPWLATEHFPYPKLLISMTAATPPRAGHLELTFPHTLLTIKDVHEENHLGRKCIVLWRVHPTQPNKLLVDWASREPAAPASQPVSKLAVAFTLSSTTPIQAGMFAIDGATKLFDVNAAEIASGSISLGGIL